MNWVELEHGQENWTDEFLGKNLYYVPCMNKRIPSKSGMEKQPAGSVLVLYENPAARERAVQCCEQLVGASELVPRPVVGWYSFEDLVVPANADAVILAAVPVDLVAFAVSSLGDFPDEIKVWMEHWLARRGDREGVLVGLILEDGGSSSGVACFKEIYLRHLAHRAGMDYLSHLPGQFVRPIPDSLDSFSQRAGRITPVLDEILHTHLVPPKLPLG